MITNYTKDEIQINIDSEVQVINSYLAIQINLINQISVFINSTYKESFLNDALLNINKCKLNISLLKNLLDILKNLQKTVEFLTKDGLDTYIKDYNDLFSRNISSIFSRTSEIENFINDVSLNVSDIVKNTSNSSIKEDFAENSIDLNKSYNTLINNTLIISELRNKVILPYNLDELKLYFSNHNDEYNNIEEIIEKNYTLPLSHFKPAPIARFREAYHLMKDKENASKINSLSLAFELLFNYNLHPAIISACKNLDELDIYLSCLEDNDLENFRKFDIKYEVPPVVSKKSKKDDIPQFI